MIELRHIRYFVAVAEELNFGRAARRLAISQPPLSQQIRALEELVGARLFERSKRFVRLTPAGETMLIEAYKLLDQADRVQRSATRAGETDSLTISAIASFASSWLVPRLGRFSKHHPGIELRVETMTRFFDLAGLRVDVVLWYGRGNYPDLHVCKFLSPPLVPVCSRRLLEMGPPIREAADCLKYPLLQDIEHVDWPTWLAAHGVTDPQATRGATFADDLLLVRAAAADQGIAIVRDIYLEPSITNGAVVPALASRVPTPLGYHLITRVDLARLPKIVAFQKWLIEEATPPRRRNRRAPS